MDRELTADERAALLRLARSALVAGVSGAAQPALPGGALRELCRGAFVTLELDGELRGCIGRVASDRPVADVVAEMAVAAALEDPRFPPLGAAEVADVTIEVSVLGPPQRLSPVDPSRIAIGRDGVIVERGGLRGLLLPQVAPAYGWGAERLLNAACEKAGLAGHAWREPGTAVFTFQADVFGE
ncbi:MAG TPA: AmmeMemoRadiSam system protein A [Gemmatimonadales bacterium]